MCTLSVQRVSVSQDHFNPHSLFGRWPEKSCLNIEPQLANSVMGLMSKSYTYGSRSHKIMSCKHIHLPVMNFISHLAPHLNIWYYKYYKNISKKQNWGEGLLIACKLNSIWGIFVNGWRDWSNNKHQAPDQNLWSEITSDLDIIIFSNIETKDSLIISWMEM